MIDGGGLPTDDDFEAWREALGSPDAFYLRCPEGHGSLPPRRVCPRCGAATLERAPLPEAGVVESFTVTHVAPPRFAEDAPYVTAVVDFGDVRLTGVVRGVPPGDVAVGDRLRPAVEETATAGDPVVVFRPATTG